MYNIYMKRRYLFTFSPKLEQIVRWWKMGSEFHSAEREQKFLHAYYRLIYFLGKVHIMKTCRFSRFYLEASSKTPLFLPSFFFFFFRIWKTRVIVPVKISSVTRSVYLSISWPNDYKVSFCGGREIVLRSMKYSLNRGRFFMTSRIMCISCSNNALKYDAIKVSEFVSILPPYACGLPPRCWLSVYRILICVLPTH